MPTETETETETELSAPAVAVALTAKGVPIPVFLAVPRFLAAWKQWENHLREKRVRCTKTADEQQIKKCLSLDDPDAAVEMIEHSIAGNYQGLFEPAGRSQRQKNEESDNGFVRREVTEEDLELLRRANAGESQ